MARFSELTQRIASAEGEAWAVHNKALHMQRRGEDVVVLSIGDPDFRTCLLYTSPSPRDRQKSRMPSSA